MYYPTGVVQNGAVRFAKPGSSYGTIQIYRNGRWGMICDNGWDIRDAMVVCRQLGYDNASQAYCCSHYGSFSGPILIERLNCTGTEASVNDCPFDNLTAGSYCRSYNQAGVSCICK